jgi:hypothetical protein
MTNGEGMATECKLIILLNNDLNTRSKSEHPPRETESQGSDARRRRILTTSNIPYNSSYCGKHVFFPVEGKGI